MEQRGEATPREQRSKKAGPQPRGASDPQLLSVEPGGDKNICHSPHLITNNSYFPRPTSHIILNSVSKSTQYKRQAYYTVTSGIEAIKCWGLRLPCHKCSTWRRGAFASMGPIRRAHVGSMRFLKDITDGLKGACFFMRRWLSVGVNVWIACPPLA